MTQVPSFVFFNYFCSIDINSWMTFLLVTFVIIFFGSLSLKLTYIISGSKVLGRLSFISISIILLVSTRFVLFGRVITFWVFEIDLPYPRG